MPLASEPPAGLGKGLADPHWQLRIGPLGDLRGSPPGPVAPQCGELPARARRTPCGRVDEVTPAPQAKRQGEDALLPIYPCDADRRPSRVVGTPDIHASDRNAHPACVCKSALGADPAPPCIPRAARVAQTPAGLPLTASFGDSGLAPRH